MKRGSWLCQLLQKKLMVLPHAFCCWLRMPKGGVSRSKTFRAVLPPSLHGLKAYGQTTAEFTECDREAVCSALEMQQAFVAEHCVEFAELAECVGLSNPLFPTLSLVSEPRSACLALLGPGEEHKLERTAE